MVEVKGIKELVLVAKLRRIRHLWDQLPRETDFPRLIAFGERKVDVAAATLE